MKMAYHIPGMDASNYLGRYCYPKFLGSWAHTNWKRKIKAFRVIHEPHGASYQEVKVWHTFGYEWVRTYDIKFIWDYQED